MTDERSALSGGRVAGRRGTPTRPSATKAVSANVRFRWYYQPGSELFVVYSEARDTDEAGVPPPVLNRSVVIKLTKLLRF